MIVGRLPVGAAVNRWKTRISLTGREQTDSAKGKTWISGKQTVEPRLVSEVEYALPRLRPAAPAEPLRVGI